MGHSLANNVPWSTIQLQGRMHFFFWGAKTSPLTVLHLALARLWNNVFYEMEPVETQELDQTHSRPSNRAPARPGASRANRRTKPDITTTALQRGAIASIASKAASKAALDGVNTTTALGVNGCQGRVRKRTTRT